MLIAYRPELENPPREGGFGIITDGGMIQLAPGLTKECQRINGRKPVTIQPLSG